MSQTDVEERRAVGRGSCVWGGTDDFAEAQRELSAGAEGWRLMKRKPAWLWAAGLAGARQAVGKTGDGGSRATHGEGGTGDLGPSRRAQRPAGSCADGGTDGFREVAPVLPEFRNV